MTNRIISIELEIVDLIQYYTNCVNVNRNLENAFH